MLLPRPPHVAPAVEAPAGAAPDAVAQRLRLVEVHQQRRALEGLEVDVDQRLLVRATPAGTGPSPRPSSRPSRCRRCRGRGGRRSARPAAATSAPQCWQVERIGGIGRPDRRRPCRSACWRGARRSCGTTPAADAPGRTASGGSSSVWPCCARLGRAPMSRMSQRYLPCSGSSCDQNQRK